MFPNTPSLLGEIDWDAVDFLINWIKGFLTKRFKIHYLNIKVNIIPFHLLKMAWNMQYVSKTTLEMKLVLLLDTL